MIGQTSFRYFRKVADCHSHCSYLTALNCIGTGSTSQAPGKGGKGLLLMLRLSFSSFPIERGLAGLAGLLGQPHDQRLMAYLFIHLVCLA